MARLRTLKPGFFTNDILAEVPPLGRLLFQGLWCLADREGRLEDRPRKIKAEILPYDDADPDELLNMLAAREFIIRYQADGHRYIQVQNFSKHQSPHKMEAASTIPAPDMHDASTVQAPDDDGLIVGSGEWEPGSGDLDAPKQPVPFPQPIRAVPKPKDEPERPNPLWDALVAGIGITPTTSNERSKYGKVVRELRDLGATPEEIQRRCANYQQHWPAMDLTPTALLEHWSRMDKPPVLQQARAPTQADHNSAKRGKFVH